MIVLTGPDGRTLRLSPDGKIVERLKDLAPVEQYREIIRDAKGRVWVGTKRALLRVEGQPGSLRLRQEELESRWHSALRRHLPGLE